MKPSSPPSPGSDAPSGFLGALKHIGPGLIVTGSIVGSGELIITTGLGAKAGFILLWLIVLGCLAKVFVQVELGRYAVSDGVTALRALDLVPGPRVVASWLVWLWAVMFAGLFLQLAGILGAISSIIAGFGVGGSGTHIALAVAAATSAVLGAGRYRTMEVLSTLMVFLFTLCTLVAAAAIQWTPDAVTAREVLSGFEFRLPENFLWAFAAFGITGVGASELIYYPYWCLEKGYARRVGPRSADPAWAERAKGWLKVMQVDAWVSLVIYTSSTVAFYILGAAVLHGRGLEVKDEDMVPTLASMYEASFGAPGLWIFLTGAFFVLYSTFFVATASNARTFADALSIFRLARYGNDGARAGVVRAACILFPALSFGIFLGLRSPVNLILAGGLAQAAMLPLIAFTALYLRYRRTDPRLRPGAIWTACLWAAFLGMAAAGCYQGYAAIASRTAASGQP